MEYKEEIKNRLRLMAYPGLNLQDISFLFGVKRSKAIEIKKKALALGGEIPINRQRVKTTCVYEAMGIDLAEETARLKRQL